MNDKSDRYTRHNDAADDQLGDIGRNIRRIFRTALDDDIPDRFSQLLARLKDQDHGDGGVSA